MTRTIVLFGRCNDITPTGEGGSLSVPWTEALNFHEMASHMIEGGYQDAVIIPVNSTHDANGAAIRITVDHALTNFKGFTARFWLGDKPYAGPENPNDPASFDFDWVAFIPCASHLT
jgi:hypothetical protein